MEREHRFQADDFTGERIDVTLQDMEWALVTMAVAELRGVAEAAELDAQVAVDRILARICSQLLDAGDGPHPGLDASVAAALRAAGHDPAAQAR